MRLVDTNVLVYAHDRSSPKQPAAMKILGDAFSGTSQLCVTPEILLELYNVITNPRRIARPLTVSQAGRIVTLYGGSSRRRKIYPDSPTLGAAIDLCIRTQTKGADVFDAYLVATALSHGVTEVYTENTVDMARFGMTVVDPFSS